VGANNNRETRPGTMGKENHFIRGENGEKGQLTMGREIMNLVFTQLILTILTKIHQPTNAFHSFHSVNNGILEKI